MILIRLLDARLSGEVASLFIFVFMFVTTASNCRALAGSVAVSSFTCGGSVASDGSAACESVVIDLSTFI